MFSPDRSRIHHKNPPENPMGLSRNARRHVIETHGYIAPYDAPLSVEMHNVHGEEAKEKLKELRAAGKRATSLEEGDRYAEDNPHRVAANGLDAFHAFRHEHWPKRST